MTNTETSIPVSEYKPISRARRRKNDFETMDQAAAQTGIPKSHFKTAKLLGAPGILWNRINWEEFAPWYEENKKRIESGLITDEGQLKAYRLIRDIIDYDLLIAKKRKDSLSPEEVKSFLAKMGEAQTSMIKSWIKEYPSKLAGRSETECSVILQEAANRLLEMYQRELNKWIKH